MHFLQENAFENVVWKMAAILSRPQCVNNVVSTDFIHMDEDYFPGGFQLSNTNFLNSQNIA